MASKQRDTRQRRLAYDAVMSRCDHPTADDVYLQTYNLDDRISKGTVYRNLSILAEQGKINHVRVPGADRYDSRPEPHYHVVCLACGKVVDAPIAYDAALDERVAKENGFVITRHRMFFEGLCPDCAAKNRKDGEKIK